MTIGLQHAHWTLDRDLAGPGLSSKAQKTTTNKHKQIKKKTKHTEKYKRALSDGPYQINLLKHMEQLT